MVRIVSALVRYMVRRPSRLTVTRPTSRSTCRCCETDGCASSSASAMSLTERSSAAINSRMSRRRGSAIALNGSDVVAARGMGPFIYSVTGISQVRLISARIGHAVDSAQVPVQLRDAVGEGCRARLQDVGRLHLEDVAVTNGRYRVPSGAAADRVHPDLLAAPRRKDHLGIAPRRFRRIDDPVAAKPRLGELREDRQPAGDLHQFFDPPYPGDQRLVPFFEEGAKPPRGARRPPGKKIQDA